ncbi:AraC family transcriptional regulator [Acholeplasma sp. OttesenSCG-928-E16]|nr:AraC family transcriptional regulator [Acholeplasma sp. OttesenSCG-928-E16]
MEWITSLKKAVSYIEKNLLSNIVLEDVADYVLISPFYFHKGFSILTGYTLSEYIRNRRLYLAALELSNENSSIIDIAYKYLYETPESFSKAYKRYHGFSPRDTKANLLNIKPFLPLNISIIIKGGKEMDYKVEDLKEFQVIGVVRKVRYDDAYQSIPKFWSELMPKICNHEAAEKHMIGMYGICFTEKDQKETFDYMIAGKFISDDIPEGFEVRTIEAGKWVKFKAVGALPTSLQTVNTFIFKEWLPGNESYELASGVDIEYYPPHKDPSKDDYECEIWLPVNELNKK